MRWAVWCLKWSLVALGAFLWCALWFERSLWLGISQTVLIGHLLTQELLTYLRRQRRDDP